MTLEKKDLEEFKEEIIHEFRMYTEGMRSDVKQVAEGHQLLNEKIDRLQEGQEELTKRVDRVELITLRLEQRQGNLEEKIEKVREELGAKIDAVATDLAAHRADTEVHRTAYRVREGSD